ncbi:MAG: NAD-dependent epimerase/dehydratase [Microbacteriaceae bacterium]|nr:NAD-dependent epimerase/dehydratase [Microbacteriaceae bacterium]
MVDRTLPTRVLVTGAAGRIGRAATQLLGDRGIAVTALALQYDQPLEADRVLVGDATDPAAVADALEGVDAVVHLAAIAHRDAGKPYDVYRTNVVSTFNVLSQAGQRGIRRAVIASSINAFGVPMNHHDVAPAYFPIDEEIPVDIDDWYSLSKKSDELTAQMVARHWGVDVAALRFPLVDTATSLLRIRGVVEGDPATRMREGWAYLDLRDAAEAIYRSLVAEWTGAVVVGLSAADTLMARPTAELVREFAPGVEVRGELTERQPLIDTTRARDILGFRPQYSVNDERHDA